MSFFSIATGLILNFFLLRWPAGDEHTSWGARMNKLGQLTRKACVSFFQTLSGVAVGYGITIFLLFIIIYSARQRSDATDGIRQAVGYICAVALSLATVYVGMIASADNFTRTCRSAMSTAGVSSSLRTAYSSGAVGSFFGQGLILFFMFIYYLFMTLGRGRDAYFQYGNRCDTAGDFCNQTLGWREVTGYVLGVSTVALLARMVAGIYAKASEVGSELIYKLEPDNSGDPCTNPASIADNSGAIAIDAGAFLIDTIDSCTIIVISAVILSQGNGPRMALPVWISASTMLTGLLSYAFVRCSNSAVKTVRERYSQMMWGLRLAMYVGGITTFVTNCIVVGILFRGYPGEFGGEKEGWLHFACLLMGVISSGLVWEFTAYFTASGSSPTRSVAAAGITGASTMLIQGTGVGLLSLLPISFILLGLIISCGAIAGQYGIVMGALGFASNGWFAMAANAIAPIASNADGAVAGSAETAGVREITVTLCMVGESCAAEARGYSTCLSFLAAFSCLAAFRQEAGLEAVAKGGTESDVVSEGIMFACCAAGAMVPLFISGIDTLAIGKATRALVDETRRQLQFIIGAGYAECNPASVASATVFPSAMGALLPALMAVLLPASVGFLVGARALSLYVAGSILSGTAVALFFSNAGATWVKSKTCIEAEGSFGGSGTDAHAAAVIGARLGSSLKDVAAPTMMSVAKMQVVTALVIAPLLFIDRRADYYLSCITEHTQALMSILSCFDWNKSYWGTLPIFFAFIIAIVFYFAYWNQNGTPAQKESEYTPSVQQAQLQPVTDQFPAIQQQQYLPQSGQQAAVQQGNPAMKYVAPQMAPMNSPPPAIYSNINYASQGQGQSPPYAGNQFPQATGYAQPGSPKHLQLYPQQGSYNVPQQYAEPNMNAPQIIGSLSDFKKSGYTVANY